jgi:GT2 family glycosyltransferase
VHARTAFQADRRLVCEVLVVDNGSTDGSVQMVRDVFPSVRLIANTKNRGFGAANNQGVAAALGRYVLLLNSDTIVRSRAIERLVAHIEQEPGLGIVGPCLLGADGRNQRSAFRFPTPPVLLLEQLSLSWLLPTASRQHRGWQHANSFSVDWLLGACLMAQRDLLAALGPFDPEFFMYAEDIDLCYRAREAGWDIRLVPDVVITHLGGGSTDHDRARLALQSTASMYLFYRKHFSRFALLLAILIFRGVAALKWSRDLARWAGLALIGRGDEQRRLLLEDLRLWVRVFRLRPPVSAPRNAQAAG